MWLQLAAWCRSRSAFRLASYSRSRARSSPCSGLAACMDLRGRALGVTDLRQQGGTIQSRPPIREARAAYVRFAESGRDVAQSRQRRTNRWTLRPPQPLQDCAAHHPVFVGLRAEAQLFREVRDALAVARRRVTVPATTAPLPALP